MNEESNIETPETPAAIDAGGPKGPPLLPVALLIFLAAPARARIIPSYLLVWLITALNNRRLLFHEVYAFNRGYPECKVSLAVFIANSKVTTVNYVHTY